MSQDDLKRQAAQAAIEYVEDDMIVGVGTGSTVNFFIEELAAIKARIRGAVSSSEASTERLRQHGIRVFELNDVGDLELYVDGADECDGHKRLIKGGGGALTREKVVAGASRRFVCIVDDSKRVNVLGRYPLPVEVVPMARSYVARQIVKVQGQPILREGYTTDNGNLILDVHNLRISDPVALERRLNDVAGCVTNGIFAQRPADTVLIAGKRGIERQ